MTGEECTYYPDADVNSVAILAHHQLTSVNHSLVRKGALEPAKTSRVSHASAEP